MDNDLTLYGYMNKLGFKDILESHNEKYEGIGYRYIIGYKTIDYYGKNRGVIGIFLGGLDSEDAYKKLVLDKDYIKDNNPYNIIANVIKSKINTSNLTDIDLDYCYWISGKNISGGVASELAKLVKETDKDVYCYTFGSPKTHIGSNYDCDYIKNIQNEDDYITKAISDNDGYRYGYTYNGSIMHNFKYNYRNLTKNNPKYTGDYQKVNSMNYIINEIDGIIEKTNASSKLNLLYDDLSKLIVNNNTDFSNTSNDIDIGEKITELKSYVQDNELRTAKTTQSYWTLAKTLEGLDEKRTNRRTYTKTIETADSEHYDYEMVNEDIINIIKNLGVWYVNHVPLYQKDSIPSYATTPARDYYDNGSEYPRDEDGNRLTDNNTETIVKDLSGKYGFFYEPFANMETTYRYDVNDGRNYYKHYLGNDCTGISQGVIYTLSEGNRGQTGDVNTASDGLFNHNASADKLVKGYDHTDEAMLNLGWEKYFLDNDGEWKKKSLKDGEVITKTLKEVYRNPNFQMSVSFLDPGDLLCCTEHVEFYIGYEYEPTYNLSEKEESDINIRKKSGISSLTLKKKATQGHSTFGWGYAYDLFPSDENYYVFENNVFKWYRTRKLTSGDVFQKDNRNYKVIWRKN